MATNWEREQRTTDCTDITDTWERSATHEIHEIRGSPNQNDLHKKIRRLFACFVGKAIRWVVCSHEAHEGPERKQMKFSPQIPSVPILKLAHFRARSVAAATFAFYVAAPISSIHRLASKDLRQSA